MKKICIFIIIIFFVVIFLLSAKVFTENNNNNNNNMNNDNNLISQFSINEIRYYSSANAISNTTNYQNPEWNLNVYQYTDIAIYLDRINENINEENYISGLYIDNINIEDSKNILVYYLNPLQFGNGIVTFENDTNVINEKLEFNIMNSNNTEDSLSYNIPIFFEDCSNPITIRYINDILKEYKVDNEEVLNYDGSILNHASVDISDLEKTISFDINIVTRDEKVHNQKVEFEIPLENSSKSIYDGSFEKTDKELNIKF